MTQTIEDVKIRKGYCETRKIIYGPEIMKDEETSKVSVNLLKVYGKAKDFRRNEK